MPAPSTPAELLELVLKSELVAPQRLDALLAQSPPGGSVKHLADRLVGAGLITRFHAEQFLQGRWRGFTIGKYRVLERIGSGGMGTVYLAEHQVVGRRVAIKVLPTSQADSPAALGRFYREARASGVLDHPNLVKAHDVDQDGNLHFLVMDYVDGTNLQDVVTRFGALSVERACHYIRQAALGLQAAHDAGLVHRDIKPANIVLERTGTVRLLDLGLARFYHDNVDPLTLKYDDNNVLGTADYVAPEQTDDSHAVDGRVDVYGLGGTFYFLLAGHPPFPTGKVAQKLIWHQTKEPTPIRQLRPDVPPGVAAIVARMMAKAAAARYQQASEVAEALAPWTVRPLPPPPEVEMPSLSPALAAPLPPQPGAHTPRSVSRPPSGPARPPSWRSSHQGARPAAAVAESNARSPDLSHTPGPLAPDAATPRALSGVRRAISPPPKLRASQPAAAVSLPPPREGRSATWRVTVLLMAGAFLGLAARLLIKAL